MELTISVEDLKDKKLFVATPMYGGVASGIYTKSVADLSAACAKYNIDLRFYFLFNESLITRARNYCVDEFLRSDYTHLMFIDSDIGFNYKDVLTLLYLTNTDESRHVVTGPYPKKTISWEKIKLAVEKGFAENNPFELENFVGDYVFNPVENQTSFRLDDLVEIREGGTGFMMIARETFEKYAEAYPDLKYIPDHTRTEHFDGSREITAYFDTIIEEETKRYLSEDYMFSHNLRKADMKIWMAPWMQLKHVGNYTFGGSLGALSAIGASPTASKESNKKHYTEQNTSGENRKQRRAKKSKK